MVGPLGVGQEAFDPRDRQGQLGWIAVEHGGDDLVHLVAALVNDLVPGHAVIISHDAAGAQPVAEGRAPLTGAVFAGCIAEPFTEGAPGLAKTLMISSIAQLLSLKFKRVQFTPDLLPSDITGTEILDEEEGTGHRRLRFVNGPIFANILLGDEINRTPPKTQAALLQAIQGYKVTYGGLDFPLERPFLVLGAQNPIEQAGTHPLPEAQLDRFMFKIQVEYPSFDEELAIAESATTGTPRASGSGNVPPANPGSRSWATTRRTRRWRPAWTGWSTAPPTTPRSAPSWRRAERLEKLPASVEVFLFQFANSPSSRRYRPSLASKSQIAGAEFWKFIRSVPPIGKDAFDAHPELPTVVVVDQLAEFVNDDAIDEAGRALKKFPVKVERAIFAA